MNFLGKTALNIQDNIGSKVSGMFSSRAVQSRDGKVPQHIRSEVLAYDTSGFYTNIDEINAKVGLSVGWVFSDIEILAKKVISSPLKVKRIEGEKSVDISNHPFEKLWASPNEFMTRSFLLQYIIFQLTVSKNGAFLYCAPNRNNPDEIVELWPIDSARVEVVHSKSTFVKHYLYTPRTGGPTYRINRDNVVWFRYPNIFDYWASMPPLYAALDPISIELGINSSQKKFYTKSRGVPLSVVSAHPDVGSADYEKFKADIKRQWENDGSSIAIARGGTIDVKTLGFSQRDLEILGNQSLTRDKIDSAIMGIPFRNPDFQSGEGLKQSEKFINSNVVHPLHVMLAEQITLQILIKYWGEGLRMEFDDIRTTDRALTMQEDNIQSRWTTIDEMRQKQGLPPLPDPEIGGLITPLATNPSFISELKGMSSDPSHIEKDPDVGNVPGARDSVATVNQLARGDEKAPMQDIKMQDIRNDLIRSDLKKWRTVAKRTMKKVGDPLARNFESRVVPINDAIEIRGALSSAYTEQQVSDIFETYLTKYN